MISYEKLRIKMAITKMNYSDLHGAGISYYVTKKLKEDDYVELRSLEKICLYLRCDIGDILEIKKE